MSCVWTCHAAASNLNVISGNVPSIVRFFSDGPAIPDELLAARDEGQVLFFCGAGVSRAQAGLPGFLDLAKGVLKALRTLPDSPAQKLVDFANDFQEHAIPGVGSVVAADRIFGLLEREFALSDIEKAVGKVLEPVPRVETQSVG